MKTLLDRIIENEVSGSRDDEMEGIGFELESSNSAYPGISCITPGDPYVLHCFPPFKSELTKEQHDHLDIIARKIRQSFSTSRPITKVIIVGHSSTWHAESRSDLERRAQERAGNAHEELFLRLQRMRLANQVEVTAVGRSDTMPWLGKSYSSTSGTQQARNERALNRRVEFFLITSKRKLRPPSIKPLKPKKQNVIRIVRRACRERDRDNLDEHIRKAVRQCRLADRRLLDLAALTDTDREQAWNSGREKIWFGSYRRGRRTPFEFVKRTVHQIARITRKPPPLTIACNYSLGAEGDCTFGWVDREIKDRDYSHPMRNPLVPPPYTINLASCWFQRPTWMAEDLWRQIRSTTIVHEAAHLAGARRLFNAKIFRSEEIVDPNGARRLAQRNPWGARVNAQNYAYYIMGM